MQRFGAWLSVLVISFALVACQQQDDKNTIRVGTIAGPETEIMTVAKQVARKTYGINIKIIEFSDYNMPNAALADGSIDANMFQHKPFLQAQQQAHGYRLATLAKTFLYPMGLYSRQLKDLKDLAVGAKVAIPNDPSNEARALLLLQKAKLITLKPQAGINATVQDIKTNPKQLQIIELEAPQLPRALDDVAIAAINTNYAIAAGLYPAEDALLHEDKHSPYANIVVVRSQDVNDPRMQRLVQALHSPAVLLKAKEMFGDDAIAAWKKQTDPN